MENITRMATNRQLWALRCATGIDYRNQGITFAEASEMITRANNRSGYVKSERKIRNKYIADFEKSYNEVVDMVHKGLCESMKYESVIMNDTEFVKDDGKRYLFVGVGCGFAWLDYDKRQKKVCEFEEHIKTAYRDRVIADVCKKFPKKVLDYYMNAGCPLQAVLSQDENVKVTYMWECAKIVNANGGRCSASSHLD
jgi:hypothetical protein